MKILEMSWLEFKKRFKAECKGVDVTCINIEKFFTLTQVIDIVKEYSNKFNHLARYAPNIANTKIRGIEKFVYGFD